MRAIGSSAAVGGTVGTATVFAPDAWASFGERVVYALVISVISGVLHWCALQALAAIRRRFQR